MGKYMKKPKTTRRPGEMEVVSQSTLGVRTRARTLALQQQRSAAVAYSPSKPDYLELRSRRLQKPPTLVVNYPLRKPPPSPVPPPVSLSSKKEREPEQQDGRFLKENHRQFDTSTPIDKQEDDNDVIDDEKKRQQQSLGFGIHLQSSEIEPSPSCFGDNYFDTAETRGAGGGGGGRTTRESTPCSLIRTSDTITAPGSSTKQRTNPANSNRRAENALLRNIPTAPEMEEFFTQAEQPLQRRFIEKYNFDIVNDVPLPGRYEWVKVMP